MENQEDELLNRIFLFSATWGIGGCLEVHEKNKFNEKFKQLLENEELQITGAK